jgi:hypothetical protein
MVRLRQFGQATLVLRYSDWITAALVTLGATYLHVLFFLNAGGVWRDEADPLQLTNLVLRMLGLLVGLFLLLASALPVGGCVTAPRIACRIIRNQDCSR